MSQLQYNFEYPERLRAGFIGCGGHAFRNVYPTFQYAPIDLKAVCDLDEARAKAYARQFGADRYYTSSNEMLSNEDLDILFIVTNYNDDGHPQATQLAIDGMNAGCHIWMEKPPAANVAQVEAMIAASRNNNRFVVVGYKKMFFPSIVKAKELVSDEAFGEPTSIYIRYPQYLPPAAHRSDDRRMVGFLDHIVHPGSILLFLMGSIESILFTREEAVGASVTTLRFESGAIGTMHLAAGSSQTSPLERLEVIGRNANLVVENGTRLTYYRPGSRGDYGRNPDYTVATEDAPLIWEPEFSLGQLYNKNLFLLGYAQSVQYFCRCVLNGTPPEKAGLSDTLELLKLYGAYRGASGVEVRLGDSG